MAPWEKCRYRVGREALGRSAGRQNNYLSHEGDSLWREAAWNKVVFLFPLSSSILIYCTLVHQSSLIALPLAVLVSHISPQCITRCQSSVRLGRLTHETLQQLQARSMMNKTQNKTQNGLTASRLVCIVKQTSYFHFYLWKRVRLYFV